MDDMNQSQETLAVEPILARASEIQDAMRQAAEVRRARFEQLTEQVRDLAAANGDLVYRVEELGQARIEADGRHAEEIAHLLGTIKELETKLANEAENHSYLIAAAKEREDNLSAELQRMTDNFTRVAREFERFVDGVGRETVAAVEAADQAERNLVTLRLPPRTGGENAPAQPKAPLRPVDNLIQMQRAPQIETRRSDDDFDENAALAEASDGFGRMFEAAQ